MSEQEAASGSTDEPSTTGEQPEPETVTTRSAEQIADPYASADDAARGAHAAPRTPEGDAPGDTTTSEAAETPGEDDRPGRTNAFGATDAPGEGAPTASQPVQANPFTVPPQEAHALQPGSTEQRVGAPAPQPGAPAFAVPSATDHSGPVLPAAVPDGPAVGAQPLAQQPGTVRTDPHANPFTSGPVPVPGPQDPNGNTSGGAAPFPNGNPYGGGPAPVHGPPNPIGAHAPTGTAYPLGSAYPNGTTYPQGTADPNGTAYPQGSAYPNGTTPQPGTAYSTGNPYAGGSAAGPGPQPPNANPYPNAPAAVTGYPGQYPNHDPNGNPYATGGVGAAGFAPGGPGGPGNALTPATWITPGVAAAAGVHAAIVFGALIAGGVLMTLAVALITSSLPDVPSPVSGGNVIQTVVQLAALIVSGGLDLSTGPMAAGISISGSLSVLPLLMTALVLATTIITAVRAERRAALPTFGTRILVSAVTGVAVSLLLMVFSLVLPVSLASMGIGLDVTARGLTTFLFGTVLIGAATFAGRLAAATPSVSPFAAPFALLRRAPRWFRETLAYATIATAATTAAALVLALVSVINAPAAAGAVLGSFPLFLNVVLLLAGLAHLGGVTVGNVTNIGGLTGSSGSEPAAITVFSAGSPWALLLILVAIVTTFVAAVHIGAARGRPSRFDPRTFWRFPLAVLVGWLLVGVLLASVSLTASGSFALGSASSETRVGATVWTPFVILLWAVAIEFAAPYAPVIAYTISPRLLTVLAGPANANAWISGTTPLAPHGAGAAPGAVGGPTYTDPATGMPVPVGPVTSGQEAWPGAAPYAPYPETEPPIGAAAANGEPPKLSPSARKGALIGGIVAGSVVVALIAGSIVVGAVNGANSPEAAARAYLEAIASGDAERANELVDPNIPTGDRALLTNATMAGATELISDVKVTSEPTSGSSTSSDTRYVSVSYRLGGVEQTGTLEVRRGENTALVFESWDVVTPILVPIEVVTAQPTSVTVGGGTVDVEAGNEGYQGDVSATGTPNVYVYPATYPIVGTDNEFFTYEPESVEATLTGIEYGSLDVELVSEPTEALQDALQEAVDAALDECAASTKSSPDGCPFAAYIWTGNPVTWSITAYPTIEITSSASFRADDLSFGYSYTTSGSRTQTGNQTVDFAGTYEIVDGKIVVDLG